MQMNATCSSLAAALALSVAQAAADELPALYAVDGVSFSDTLNVRAKPDASSPVEARLAPDATDIEVTGFSRDGSWARVSSGERPGWSAARFLKRQEQAPWWNAATALYCHGTEPFWSLEVGAGKTVFDSPDGREAPAPVRERGASEGAGILGLQLAQGFAIVRRAECSDGMSDRVYGLAVDLFRPGEGGLAGVSGCCSLVP